MDALESAMAKIKAEGAARKHARRNGLPDPEPALVPAPSKAAEILATIAGVALLMAIPVGLIALLMDCSTTTADEAAEQAARTQEAEAMLREIEARKQIEFENARLGCAAGIRAACEELGDILD